MAGYAVLCNQPVARPVFALIIVSSGADGATGALVRFHGEEVSMAYHRSFWLLVAILGLALALAPPSKASVLGCTANGLTPDSPQNYESSSGWGLSREETWKAIVGDPLIMAVGSRGGFALWICQPDGIKYQFYSNSDWGTKIWLDGDSPLSGFYSPYFDSPHQWTNMDGTGTPIDEGTLVMNVAGDVSTITHTFTVGPDALVSRIVSYRAGDYGLSIRYELTNTSGSDLSNLRLVQGGDTYFGWDDYSRSWWDESRRMIYINNDFFANSGTLSYQGSALTPADHHFAGYYEDGWHAAASGETLPDTVVSEYEDMSAYLEWDRALLAPGETWVVESVMIVTDPTPLVVIGPENASAVNNQDIPLVFTIQNLDEGNLSYMAPANEVPHTINLSATCSLGWPVTVSGENQLTLQSFEKTGVQVSVHVPIYANAGETATIKLIATDANDETVFSSASTTIEVIANRYSISTLHQQFPATRVGDRSFRTITLSNDAGGSDVVIGEIGGSDPVSGMFSVILDSCSGATVRAGENCSLYLAFAPDREGEADDSFNLPVLAPFSQNWNIRLSGSAGMKVLTLHDESINYSCFFDALLR